MRLPMALHPIRRESLDQRQIHIVQHARDPPHDRVRDPAVRLHSAFEYLFFKASLARCRFHLIRGKTITSAPAGTPFPPGGVALGGLDCLRHTEGAAVDRTDQIIQQRVSQSRPPPVPNFRHKAQPIGYETVSFRSFLRLRVDPTTNVSGLGKRGQRITNSVSIEGPVGFHRIAFFHGYPAGLSDPLTQGRVLD